MKVKGRGDNGVYAAVQGDEERGEEVEEVLGGGAVQAAVQGRWLGGERQAAAEPVPEEQEEGLQMGGRPLSQDPSQPQPLLSRPQGFYPHNLFFHSRCVLGFDFLSFRCFFGVRIGKFLAFSESA